MSDKNLKAIRGQVRQVVKEFMTTEQLQAVLKEVTNTVNKRLDAIDAHVKSQLKEINERSQETQSYVVRNLALATTKPAPVKVDETA